MNSLSDSDKKYFKKVLTRAYARGILYLTDKTNAINEREVQAMAYDFKSLNKTSPKKFNYDESIERPFTTLSKLYAEDPKAVHTVRGVWINKKDKYGDRPEIVLDHNILDAPRSTIELWKNILSDEAAIKAINNGECKFTVNEFYSERYFKDIYTFNFI